MDDQALDGAVAPAIEDRIAAALGEPVETVNLEPPADAELPQGERDGEAPKEEASEEAPKEEAKEETSEEAPPAWDEVREIKLKVPVKNGAEEKELEVTLDELRLGYMRQDDYQRKTQEVAKARAEAQAEVQKHVGQIQERVIQELRSMEAFIQNVAMPELQHTDWNRLAQEDPAQFVQMSHRANQMRQAMEAVKQQLQAAEAQRISERQKSQAQAIEQAANQLKTEIPNWGDELQKTLAKTGSDMGFTSEELASVVDPRFVKLLWKAHQFDSLQAQKPIVEKKVAIAPKVLKPSAPQHKAPQTAKADELRRRIKKSGGRDKAAVEQLIGLKLGMTS